MPLPPGVDVPSPNSTATPRPEKTTWEKVKDGAVDFAEAVLHESQAIPLEGAIIGTLGKAKGLVVAAEEAQAATTVIRSAYAAEQSIQFGKNAVGHLVKHADALGFGNVSPQELQKMVPQLKEALIKLYQAADQSLSRVGQWHQYADARFYISSGRTIVTQADGTFITVINGTNNGWFRQAQAVTP